MQDTGTVLMGTTLSSIKEIGNRKGSIAAGLAVRLHSNGTIVTTKASGNLLGISLGRDLSATDKTAICYKGVGVPIQLTSGFTPALGATCYIDDVTGKAKASATDATAVNAVFTALLPNGGVPEEGGSNVLAAIIDFPGGL